MTYVRLQNIKNVRKLHSVILQDQISL